MIAKIMKSASSFQAVYYNENKIKEQKAVLLSAVNFESNGFELGYLTKKDFITYLNQVSNLNDNVKNKQFHAVLSTKGREHNAEELKMIAHEYLKKMGYSENPYLIYFHQDTDNNHVHIVSTRVNTEGVRIDDSFERRRSLKYIEAIMNNLSRSEMSGKTIVDEALQFRFSTEAQLKLILEQKGYSVQNNENRDILVLKDKNLIATVDREKVVEKLKLPTDSKRAKQLGAILSKYKNDVDTEGLQKLIKNKFGVELVFHKGEGKEKPYGYTVIDHSTKQVFKGSEVLKLSEILQNNVDRAGESKGQTHEEAVKKLKNQPQELDDYLLKNGLLIADSNGKTYLFDMDSGDAWDISSDKGNALRSFINLDDSYFMNQNDDNEAEMTRFHLNLAGADENDTDRKYRKGMKK